MSPRKVAVHLAQAAVFAACAWYVLRGVDLGELWRALAGYSPLRMGAVLALVLATFALQGLRLSLLSGRAFRALRGAQAVLLGLAVNNVLPARLGEVAKMVYLRQKTALRLSQVLGMVFLERFLDVNVVAVLAFGAATVAGLTSVGLPLLAVLALCWVVLIVLVVRMPEGGYALGFIPAERIREFLAQALGAVGRAAKARAILAPLLVSICIWALAYTFVTLMLVWLAGLDLTLGQALVAFAALFLGVSIPGMPGGIGVAEAAVVVVLGWYGVAKPEALAAALAIRAMNFLPATILGGLVFLFSGMDRSMLHEDMAEDG